MIENHNGHVTVSAPDPDARVIDYSASSLRPYLVQLFPGCDPSWVSATMIEAARQAEKMMHEHGHALERSNCLLREAKDVLAAEMMNLHPRIAELEHTVAFLRGHVAALKRALVVVLREEEP